MEEDLRHLVGSVADPETGGTVEVNWVVHPQGVPLPAVVLNLIAGAEGYTQQGPDGLTQASVQVDVYALDLERAVALARVVRDALSGFRGAGRTGFFEGIFQTATRSGREGGTNEADRPFRHSMDFDVNWRMT